ncbi:MAG: hypothetical protein RL681_515 [Candidatus Parcubacteria bacterium]|jgi:hypothetical protein
MGRRYIIIGFAAFAVILVVAGLVLSRTGGNGGKIVTAPSASDENINEYQDAGTEALGAPEGDTFMISVPGVSVRVKNFYRSAVRVVENTEVVIAETSDYRVSYIRPFTLFTITVWGERAAQARQEAERALLKALNISEASACRLNVEVWLSPATGLSDAGKPLPLSFCRK